APSAQPSASSFPLSLLTLHHSAWETVSGGKVSLRLWDAPSGNPISEPLKGHSGPVFSVAFSPDGSRIVSGSADNTLRLWPVLDSWATHLCAKLPRNMTRQEWREWISPDIDYVVQCPGLPVPAD
ncbi:WD40 repeat protein, partial [Sphaerotilus sulfidivorans]